MSLTELFIRRPVMTVLLNIALIAVGLAALGKIPVAALPRYDTPTINVSANLNGASPETMARSVALPLEKQFSTIAGVDAITFSAAVIAHGWAQHQLAVSTKFAFFSWVFTAFVVCFVMLCSNFSAT